LSPSYASAHYNLGTLLLKRKDYQAALEPLKEAISLNPQWSDAWYNLAAVYAQMGERVNAVQCLKKAIEFNPALISEAQQDSDFQSLHADGDFGALIENCPSCRYFSITP
jgi:tetratricopeptide (TPR) repeat protein